MAHYRPTTERGVAARVGGVIVAATAVLTVSFFGLVALATGAAVGLDARLPFYVLGGALAFVGGVVALESRRIEGRRVIAGAAALAAAAFVTLSLGGEGVVYAARNPGQALAARRLLYLVAAGLTATGLGYWALNHWRTLAPSR